MDHPVFKRCEHAHSEHDARRTSDFSAGQLVYAYVDCTVSDLHVSHRIFPKNKFRRVVFLSGVIFIITAILCIFDAVTGLNHRVYYISELAFPFGVIIYEYADFFAAFLKKKYALPSIIAAELVFSFFAITVPEKSLPDLIFHNLMNLFFGLLLIWLLDKFKVGNRILRTMNPYAPFLYLFQFAVLDVTKNYYITNARPFESSTSGACCFSPAYWLLYFSTCIILLGQKHTSTSAPIIQTYNAFPFTFPAS